MEFIPNYTLNILQDAEFSQGITDICAQLDKCRVSGQLVCRDGVKLFYEYFLAAGAKTSIVMVHGMSEFTCKNYELAYYLLHQGYNVFLYDQRCHGFSDRLTDQIDLIHVGKFSDYVEDLQEFVEKIVRKATDTPLYLYGHSMGGAVSLLHLAKYPETFRKAVISSPLFEPHISVPVPIAMLSARINRRKVGDKGQFVHSNTFTPEIPENWRNDPAYSRNKHMLQLRIDTPNYQSTPMTTGFALRALYLTPQLMRTSKKIRTPHLLISGQADTVVKDKPHVRYARRTKLCRFISVPEGKHAMMCEDYQNVAVHTHLVLDYFREDSV